MTADAAWAQTQQADASAPTSSGAIEEVVVTAERRPEYAKDVPFAVTSLNAQTVTSLTSGGDDIRFLAARVPSLNIESSFGRTYPRFYIRGLGNSDYTYNAQQPVSVLYDDVVVENPILKAFPVFDTSDVEVLRGPQGTLFGRNTPAGVVKIDSTKPKDEFSGYADMSYGTYNTLNFNAALGGAIVPGLLDFRVSVLEERRDDWVHNTNPATIYHHDLEGYSDTAGRFQLLYKPSDTLDVLWEVDGRALDGTARLFRADIIQKGTNNLIAGFDVAKANLDGDNYQNLGTWGTHLTIDNDFGPVALTSITAYEHGSTRSRGDIDGGNFSVPPPVGTSGGNFFSDETSDQIPGLDQITQELRVATMGNGPFFDQAGFFYFHEYLHVTSFDYFPTSVVDIILNQVQSTESFGVFDSGTYKVTDDLTFGAGVRYSTDDKHFSVNCPLACTAPTPNSISVSGSDVTFNVNVNYAITPDINAYGRIATGYLAPALDARNVEYDFGDTAGAAPSQSKAETTTSYEVGLKAALLDHRARASVAAYTYTTDDLQLTAVGGSTNSTELLNAKKAIGEGFEAEFEYKPIDPLLLTASGSYNFTQIQDPNLEVAGCGACTMLSPFDAVTGKYHIDHNSLPQAPRWVVDWTARYTVPITDDTEVYASTDWSYRSSVNFFLYKSVEFTGQPLLQGGARIGYIDNTRNFEVAAYVRNITDEVKVTGAIDFDNLTGFVNDPRIIGVEGRIKF